MDTKTGSIFSSQEMESIKKVLEGEFVPQSRKIADGVLALKSGTLRPMDVPPTLLQRMTRRIGRNHPCPCGSGKKFKRCCYTGSQ